MTTLRHHVTAAAHRLREAGIPPAEADVDARLLAQEALGWDTTRYLTSSAETAPLGFQAGFDPLIARREGREPMAYILGRQEFWGRVFAVTPAVLIPRPETELIVETALELCPKRESALRVADIGTGSGCLAVTLAAEFPNATIVATDRSEGALVLARRNAGHLGLAHRIAFVQADVLSGIDGAFDLIVSNPPYVPEADRQALQPEVIGYEPEAALFGGPDGLSVVRRVVGEAASRLTPSGWLVVEFGAGQADLVAELISATPGLTMGVLRRDLQGIPRTAVARAAGAPSEPGGPAR